MKPCYLATAVATILCLLLGSVLFKDTPEERKEIEDFVGRLSQPAVREESPDGQSPNMV